MENKETVKTGSREAGSRAAKTHDMTEEKKKQNSRSRKAQKHKSREAGKAEKQKRKEAGKAEKQRNMKSREAGKAT